MPRPHNPPEALAAIVEVLMPLHERLCPRQVLGARIGLQGRRLLGLRLPQTRGEKQLLTFIETDGCFADGVGDFGADINHTWAAMVGPGVLHKGVDNGTWADHTDLRPTMMTLLCLQDTYTHEGRALFEDLKNSALPDSGQDMRGSLTELGRTFKQLNAPVGVFGSDAIHVSTTAIKGDQDTYTSLENQLSKLVTERDARDASVEGQLDKVAGCTGFGASSEDDREANRSTLDRLNDGGQEILSDLRRLAGEHAENNE